MGNEASKDEPPTREVHRHNSATTGDDISVLTTDTFVARHGAGITSKPKISHSETKYNACTACFVRINADASFCQACEDAMKVDMGIDPEEVDDDNETSISENNKKLAASQRKCPACQGIIHHNNKDQLCEDCQAVMLPEGDEWESSDIVAKTQRKEEIMSPPPSRPPQIATVTPHSTQELSIGSTHTENFTNATLSTQTQSHCLACQARFVPGNPSTKLCNICMDVMGEPPTKSEATQESHSNTSHQETPIYPYRKKSSHDIRLGSPSFSKIKNPYATSKKKTPRPNAAMSAPNARLVSPSSTAIKNLYATSNSKPRPDAAVSTPNNHNQNSSSPQTTKPQLCRDCGVATDAEWKVRCVACWSTWKNQTRSTVKRRLDFEDTETEASVGPNKKTGKTTAEV